MKIILVIDAQEKRWSRAAKLDSIISHPMISRLLSSSLHAPVSANSPFTLPLESPTVRIVIQSNFLFELSVFLVHKRNVELSLSI